MRIRADEHADRSLLVAEQLPQTLRFGLPPADLTAALGRSQHRFDWEARAGAPALIADNPGAEPAPSGPAFDQLFEDGRVTGRSGAAASLIIERGQRPDARLMMPNSFTFLIGQQWARTGAVPIHGAVFRYRGRGVLALGRRGSGKSILGLSAVVAGGRLVSDDSVLLGLDEKGAPVAERMREFFMVRHSWAGDRLFARLTDIPSTIGSRPKTVYRLPDREDPRFCVGCGIDDLWLLERPRGGRRSATSWAPAQAATGMARLIESSVALLFGPRYPHERAALLEMSQAVLRRVACRTVAPGTDLVEAPERVFERLWSRQTL